MGELIATCYTARDLLMRDCSQALLGTTCTYFVVLYIMRLSKWRDSSILFQAICFDQVISLQPASIILTHHVTLTLTMHAQGWRST
ncbi:hypothetical protein CY34DRAFT_801339 [Suillus luteus UH-Slu-Lm8-n1]|uniref:Uncharacterized protein n=1 Tax=Suillus luteus UH-Slu-Lm8-n1 TaxID=930992 RepID=A0A0D0B7A8_9AGAM|nr:hypothetical protein CY34DRAFT_801339 [Suillus luteus UH-Slu-Lm8-n1]